MTGCTACAQHAAGVAGWHALAATLRGKRTAKLGAVKHFAVYKNVFPQIHYFAAYKTELKFLLSGIFR